MLSYFFPFSLFFVKSILALLVSFSVVVLFGNRFIKLIKKMYENFQPIQNELPENHKTKVGTPTMGGILVILATLFSTLLFAKFNPFLVAVLVSGLGFCAIGFYDDYSKVRRKILPGRKDEYGLSAKMRLLLEFAIAAISIFLITSFSPAFYSTTINLPFLHSLSFDAGFLYYIFAAIVIVGSANAVNITDGLDGLATKTSLVSLSMFAFTIYFVSDILLSSTHNLLFIQGSQELLVFVFALFGALLGFLFFNAKPASIFMGDVGSLFLGAVFGTLAVILKAEFLFAIFGFVFVAELASTFFQSFYYKMTKVSLDGKPLSLKQKLTQINGVVGKRLFKMAPLHHHFEQLGWAETKVVERFFIFSIILAILASLAFFVKGF